MSKKIIINESQLKAIMENGIDRYNIKGVYHVSHTSFEEFQNSINYTYIFFSNKPIVLSGSRFLYKCDLSIKNPFVFEHGFSWSYPLWLYLTNKNGELISEEEFTREKYDGLCGAPYEFWKMVYEDDFEWEADQIPELVKHLNMGYDGVIIEDVQEGDTGIFVDDYIVFNPDQVKIISKREI